MRLRCTSRLPEQRCFAPCRLACLLAAAGLLLGACATPVFKDVDTLAPTLPSDVQQSPGRHVGSEVICGGLIIGVANRDQTTEVEVIGYALDRDRQPMPDAPTVGRFIIILPGFVEPFDYPAGRHLSVHGRVSGTRLGQVEEHEYLYPLLQAREVKVWPWGFMFDKKPRINVGVGVMIR